MKKKKISRRKFLTILGVTGGVLVAGGVGGAAYIRSRFTPDTTPAPARTVRSSPWQKASFRARSTMAFTAIWVSLCRGSRTLCDRRAGHSMGRCPQGGQLRADVPQGSMLGFGAGNQDGTDNNCQNLNIWTPGLNDGGLRPVLVWLHGGGFSTGTANDSSYDGEALAKNGDVVVVSVNHRLNVFGYLDLLPMTRSTSDSANVGMWDIIAALEWIQQNIEVFGGDRTT